MSFGQFFWWFILSYSIVLAVLFGLKIVARLLRHP